MAKKLDEAYLEALDKIADLEEKLAEAQKTIEIQRMSNDALIDENLDYRYDITDSAYEQAKYMAESWEEDYQQKISDLEAKLTDSEKQHLLDEIEWQNYCAFKHIEPQIKGCLDRERELNQQLAEKEKEIKDLKEQFDMFTLKNAFKYQNCMEKSKMEFAIDYAIEQLEKVLPSIKATIELAENRHQMKDQVDIIIGNQIKELKGSE